MFEIQRRLVIRYVIIILLEYLTTSIYRLLCFTFNIGMTTPHHISEKIFWANYLAATNERPLILLISTPLFENLIFILLPYFILVHLGHTKDNEKTFKVRLVIFCILVSFLFPYAHSTDITSYAFTSVIIGIIFMLYVFLYTIKTTGSVIKGYLASVLIHSGHNLFSILSTQLPEPLLGIKVIY